MKIKPLPPLEYLQECFEYNADTGEVFWKVRPLHHFKNSHAMNIWNSQQSNKKIDCIKFGYIVVKINYVIYQLHRIIWKLNTGNEPKELIDHKDGNKLNNRIENLREASQSECKLNNVVRKNNQVGIKGLHIVRGKYRTTISHNGKQYNLGCFDTIEEASKVHQEASLKYHGEFSNYRLHHS
jgi:hypothetical protein